MLEWSSYAVLHRTLFLSVNRPGKGMFDVELDISDLAGTVILVRDGESPGQYIAVSEDRAEHS